MGKDAGGGTQLGAEALGDAAGAVGAPRGVTAAGLAPHRQGGLKRGTFLWNITPERPLPVLILSALHRGALNVRPHGGTHFGLPRRILQACPVQEGALESL